MGRTHRFELVHRDGDRLTTQKMGTVSDAYSPVTNEDFLALITTPVPKPSFLARVKARFGR